MTPFLLNYLCQPGTNLPLNLVDASYDKDGMIESGLLLATDGSAYPIVNGIPRFLKQVNVDTVASFGDQWNYFNFTDFKQNWLQHTVASTFGSTEEFRNKIIVDAGGGSGAQTLWFLESGAKHVIMMELSHSVDDVVKYNLTGYRNVDVIQCSIDAPPLKDKSIDGIVYCHNVIMHTPSVEKTAHALFGITAPSGEFVFNCYGVNDGPGMLRWLRFHIIGKGKGAMRKHMTDRQAMAYAYVMAWIRFIPVLGWVLEKSCLIRCGDVPLESGEYKLSLSYLKRRFKQAYLNMRDEFGQHSFQHSKTESELRDLLHELQPDDTKILNVDKYFMRPPPIGCAFRIFR